MPGQHGDGDARVTELDERATLAVNALTGQEKVFRAHVSMDQVFILLQRERVKSVWLPMGQPLLLPSLPVSKPGPSHHLSIFPRDS